MDVDEQVWVSGGVGPWERHAGRRSSASTAADADLAAGKVELSSVGVEGLVESDVFESNQVFSVGNALRNCD